MSRADDVRYDAVSLLMLLVDLADYTREDLIELVDEAIERSSS